MSRPLSQDCLSCPNLQLAGAGAGVGKCEDFASFFWRCHSTPKLAKRDSGGFFVEFFFDTHGLDPVPPNSVFDTGSPNSVSILVRPTGPEIRFLSTGSPNGSGGVSDFFKYWFAQRVCGSFFKYWLAQRPLILARPAGRRSMPKVPGRDRMTV